MANITKRDSAPIIVQVKGVTKRYPGVLALDNADFSMREGEVRALLGKNGAGKSTLIRALTGAETPDAGSVEIAGVVLSGTGSLRTFEAKELGVRAVYQELSLVPGMSIAENLFLGHWPAYNGVLDHKTMVEESKTALASVGLEIDPNNEVSTLSLAEQQLVEIARAIMGQPKLVILDEPTSSLHQSEVELVFRAVRALSGRGIAVVYVSHRMVEIREIAESATVVRDGRIIDTFQIAEANTDAIVRMMLGKGEAEAKQLVSHVKPDVILRVKKLVAPPKIKSLDFDLHAGEVLGIAGILGSGRTELLRAIAGIDRPESGIVEFDGHNTALEKYHLKVQAGIGMTSENRKTEGILPLLGVDENIVLTDLRPVSDGFALSWAEIKRAASTVIELLSIKVPSTKSEISTLSGGNQQKAVIGRWVHAKSRVLLMDEPTRGVDIESKNEIYEIIRNLAAEGAGIIFVSSEVEEMRKVCDRVIVLVAGEKRQEYQGTAIDTDTLMAASMA